MTERRRPRRTGSAATLVLVALLLAVGCGVPYAPVPLARSTARTAPSSVVKVVGAHGNWRLTVDGADYQVKGVTYGQPDAVAAVYLPDIRAMGANTIRTWGSDATTRLLLSAADANGIKVISGIWLRHDVDYVHDTSYKRSTLNEVRTLVRTLRHYPGLLMWDVGNEVLGSLPYSGAELQRQRRAFVRYVDQVAEAIHAIDPDHPVTSSESWTGFWRYYKKAAPHVDLYSVNSYGSICNVQHGWSAGRYAKPYLVTETGPPGYWEVPKDPNGVPVEPSDVEKAAAYADAWRCVRAHPGVALGATLFNYGTLNDFDGAWWGIRTSGLHRLSYYAVARLYGGARPPNKPPIISDFRVDSATTTTTRPRRTLVLRIRASDPDDDKITYRMRLCSIYIDKNKSMVDAASTKRSDGSYRITVPNRPGVWKVYVFAEDGRGNVGVASRSVRVPARSR